MIFLAVVVPARLVMLIVELALMGPRILEPGLLHSTAMMAAQIHGASQNMPVTAGLLFLVAPVLLGLILGAGAHAYRALGSEPAAEFGLIPLLVFWPARGLSAAA